MTPVLDMTVGITVGSAGRLTPQVTVLDRKQYIVVEIFTNYFVLFVNYKYYNISNITYYQLLVYFQYFTLYNRTDDGPIVSTGRVSMLSSEQMLCEN
jgi:hypothetical protein